MHTQLPEEQCSLVDQCILGGAGERQDVSLCSLVFTTHFNKPWVAMVLSCRCSSLARELKSKTTDKD